MRIAALRVEGFGVWSGLELADLSENLNVFYGPNEAGKSTLLQFVRSVFYGFSAERRAQYLPPRSGDRAGGTIQVVAGADRFAVSRFADDASGGEALVAAVDGQAVRGQRGLATLLGDIDESIFNNVFAFGLQEIQELGTLSGTQAADELYNLALGLDRVSLVDVLSELETSRNRLLAPDDRPSLVTQLLAQRQRLQDEVEQLGQSTVRWLTLSAEREKLGGDITRLEGEKTRLETEAQGLSLARSLRDHFVRRASIDEQLRSLIGFESLPTDALARFDRINARLTAHRRRLARLKEHRGQLRREIQELNINEALCRQAMRLEALAEQQPWIGSLESQASQLKAEIDNLESQRSQDSTATLLGGGAPSKRQLRELRETAKALSEARREVKGLQSSSTAAEESGKNVSQQLERALGSVKDKGLTQALAEAGDLVSQLRKRVQLDERLDQMTRRQTELEEDSQTHLDRQILPTWVLAVLGCLFVLGCALVLLYVAGLVLPASLSGTLGWPLGALGLLAVGTAGGLKYGLEGSAARQLDTCHAQLSALSQQIEEATTERDELDEVLPRGGGPLVARLMAAEKQLARLEELLPLESQREAAQRDVQAAQEHSRSRHNAYRRLRANWRRLLIECGLPDDTRPHNLAVYLRRREEMTRLEQHLAGKKEELAKRKAEYEAVAGRIAAVMADSGLAPSGGGPLERLQQSLVELKQQQQRIGRRDELAREVERVRRRRVRWAERADKLKQRRQQIMRAAGTVDELEFRRIAQAQADSLRLTDERSRIGKDIAAAIAGHCSEEKLAFWLRSPQELEQAEAQSLDARRTVAGQLAESIERRGEMNQQLKTLIEDRQLPQKRLELGIVEKRLQDALERWRVVAICRMLLEAVREYYEREYQPHALREASEFLERLTEGRYPRVWTPLGQHALRVDDDSGNSLGVEVLSRGTREQVFLALRLALVNSFVRRGTRLPLVLDDVLVNFDVNRAKAAALVLRDFAKAGNQVFVFTCHEHIAKLFKHIKADVRQLPDNRSRQISDSPQPARRARRKPVEEPETPKPEPEPTFDPVWDAFEVEAMAVEAPPPPPPIPEPEPQPAPVEVAVEAAPAPPPPKPRRPARTTRRASPPRTERVRWSAEEFEGELSDRVRRPGPTEEIEVEESSPSDDAEAA